MSVNTHSLDLELSSNQYASITGGSQTGLNFTGDFSIEAWIKLEQLPSTAGTNFAIAGKYDNDANLRSYIFWIDTNNKLNLIYYQEADGNPDFIETSSVVFDAGDVGVWRHFAVTADVSEKDVKFYVDTVLDESSTNNSGTATFIVDTAALFTVGMLYNNATPIWFADHKIDELRVWNDIRSGAEITTNWKTQLVGDEAGLVAYWRFNNNYLDQTANNNDLTATGSPVFSTDVPFPIAVVGGGNPINFANSGSAVG